MRCKAFSYQKIQSKNHGLIAPVIKRCKPHSTGRAHSMEIGLAVQVMMTK